MKAKNSVIIGQKQIAEPGKPGDPGKNGYVYRPRGLFASGNSYVWNDDYRDICLMTFNKTIYTFRVRTEGSIVTIPPSSSSGDVNWEAANELKFVATDVLIALFGMIGSAVFYDEYMISQEGVDKDGNPSTDYKGFEDGTFIPNISLNFLTGEVNFGIGTFRGEINAKSGKIGGFDIDEYGLKNTKGKTATIDIHVTGQNIDRRAVLGNTLSSLIGYDVSAYMSATSSKQYEENRALMLRATGSTMKYGIFGGNTNLCIDAVGGTNWNMKQDDHWCMPGVLACAEYALSYNSITGVRKWGNGCTIGQLSRDGDGLYRLKHDIGHTDYYAVITPYLPNIDGNWWATIVNLFEKSNTNIGFQFRNDGGSVTHPTRFEVMFFGRPSVNI